MWAIISKEVIAQCQQKKSLKKVKKLLPILNEYQKRLYLASEAEALGHGWITALSNWTGISRGTITNGMKELSAGVSAASLAGGGQGTSKWNKIEHRLFSQITKNWRGRPLETLKIIVSLIAATTTANGLKVRCKADRAQYPTGIKVTDEELSAANLFADDFHPEWNYVIKPNCKV